MCCLLVEGPMTYAIKVFNVIIPKKVIIKAFRHPFQVF